VGGEKARWFGPGETARRLGVTTKALRVYEREGLVSPHRAPSGWRLYGPDHFARLHQIIVLRDLGLTLKSVSQLVVGQSPLREVLRLQREALARQHARMGRAIELIETAERRLDLGQDLSVDDLTTLTKETAVQQSDDMKAFQTRFEALVAERDPTGQASLAVQALKQAASADSLDQTLAAQVKAIMAEAGRLKETGEIDSPAAKQMARRLRALTATIERPAPAQVDILRGAYVETLAEAEARSAAPPFDAAALDFIRSVMSGMKARGELT
jgi:DNA-binding transcriptional MerR regulator